MTNWEIKPDETADEYGYRLYKNKPLYGLNNQDIGEILNSVLNVSYGESAHRKYFTPYIKGFDDGYEKALNDSKNRKEFNSLTPKSHISKIQELIPEYNVTKRQMQIERMQLSKLNRELMPALALAEDRRFVLEDNGYEINFPIYCYEPIINLSDNKIIVQITDWHIGYVINNCKGNYYNYKIANKRVDLLIEEIKKKALLYNVNHIYIANTGDMVEHAYMRKNQSQFCEFGLLKQIDKAEELISKLIVSLAEVAVVEYNSLAGNHDRASGDKKESLKGDNANVTINKDIRNNVELAQLKNDDLHRIVIHDYDEMQDEFFFIINGESHKFIHGDGKKGNASQLIQSEMSMDDAQYHLWKGHHHNFNIVSENNGRYIISGGSLSGFNDYSTAFGCSTIASQIVAVLDKDGKFEEIKDVNLQIV